MGPKLPTGWPRSGAINFDNVVMKYAPHLPPALRGVSFKIKSGEKVGAGCWLGAGREQRLGGSKAAPTASPPSRAGPAHARRPPLRPPG